MRSNQPRACFTRFPVEADVDTEVAELQNVMTRIQTAVRDAVPRSHQGYVGNALLNLAISRMVSEAGTERTATMLIRLVDSVLERAEPPAPEAPIDLNSTHS